MRIFTFLLLALSLDAAPAYNAYRTFSHADGSTFEARAQGSHHLNWIETKEGEILKYNPQTKDFEYAVIENESLKPSGERLEIGSAKRAQSRIKTPKLNRDALRELYIKKEQAAHKKQHD
ncbi:MAG: hypothetical protein IE916_11560 [Epsilonproteobacteria bacterium]|nr:hypothetical protein [Campylobacterota bacterium]